MLKQVVWPSIIIKWPKCTLVCCCSDVRKKETVLVQAHQIIPPLAGTMNSQAPPASLSDKQPESKQSEKIGTNKETEAAANARFLITFYSRRASPFHHFYLTSSRVWRLSLFLSLLCHCFNNALYVKHIQCAVVCVGQRVCAARFRGCDKFK